MAEKAKAAREKLDPTFHLLPAGSPMGYGPPDTSKEDALRAIREATDREVANLPGEPPATKMVALNGLENMAFRLQRITTERDAIDEEERKDRAQLEASREHHNAGAVAAVVAGQDMDFSATTKEEMRFGSRQEQRTQRRAALERAEPTIQSGIFTALAEQVRRLRGWMRTRTREIVVEQEKHVRALIALHEEEVEMHRRALGEIGRVRKVLPTLQLPPATREEGGQMKEVLDGRGGMAVSTIITAPRTIAQLDTPDLKAVRSFLEDHHVGVPPLATSRRSYLLGRLTDILTAMRDEGHHVT